MKKGLLLFLAATYTFVANASESTSVISTSLYQSYMHEAKTLVQNMSTEEKVGQMLMPTLELLGRDKSDTALTNCRVAWKTETDLHKLGEICGLDGIRKYHLGAVLNDGAPLIYTGDDQTRADWRKAADIAQSFYSGPAKTSLLLGTDAIHGDQHIPGAILFPHNIGLGATHNPELVKKVAYWTGQDVLTTGFNWSLMPSVAIAHDYRWGRTYESFSIDPAVVKTLARSYMEGLQNIKGAKLYGVVGNAKHFIGDGATKNGQDEGYVYEKDPHKFWQTNGAGYEGAIEADVGSLMASYSSLNDIPMHFGGDGDLLNRIRHKGIKGTDQHIYQFSGFIVSDYVGVSRALYKYNALHKDKLDYVDGVAKSVNAGIDMLMLGNGPYEHPFNYELEVPYKVRSKIYYNDVKTVQKALLSAVSQNLISKARIDDAVIHILAVKLAMAGDITSTNLSAVQKQQQAQIALEAAQQSLVLLKNDQDTLPLRKDGIQDVFLLGEYNDMGTQNGGWSIHWQGQKGNKFWPANSELKKSAAGSTILDGVLSKIAHNKAHYHYGLQSISPEKLANINAKQAIAIVVIAEPPYAEYMGDVDNDNPWYTRGALHKENNYMPQIQSKYLGLQFSEAQAKAIVALKQHGVKIITVVFSGRPVVITDGGDKAPLQNSDVLIAAFLPGTTGGEAISNAIFGDYKFKSHQNIIAGKTYFSNTLPFAWPASMAEVRNHNYSLFALGYGLATK